MFSHRAMQPFLDHSDMDNDESFSRHPYHQTNQFYDPSRIQQAVPANHVISEPTTNMYHPTQSATSWNVVYPTDQSGHSQALVPDQRVDVQQHYQQLHQPSNNHVVPQDQSHHVQQQQQQQVQYSVIPSSQQRIHTSYQPIHQPIHQPINQTANQSNSQTSSIQDWHSTLFEDLRVIEQSGLMSYFDEMVRHAERYQSQANAMNTPGAQSVNFSLRTDSLQTLVMLLHRMQHFRTFIQSQPISVQQYVGQSNHPFNANQGLSAMSIRSPPQSVDASSNDKQSISHSLHATARSVNHAQSTSSLDGQPVHGVVSSPSRSSEDGPSRSDRSCRPSQLITKYSNLPIVTTTLYLQKRFVTAKKALDALSDEERLSLTPLTVRWMGSSRSINELYVVATDICALINIRKSNTAKAISIFSSNVDCMEKASMPVETMKGVNTHILTVLSLAGVRRLLANSRAQLASAVLHYIVTTAQKIVMQPNFDPVSDPTQPTLLPNSAPPSFETQQVLDSLLNPNRPVSPVKSESDGSMYTSIILPSPIEPTQPQQAFMPLVPNFTSVSQSVNQSINQSKSDLMDARNQPSKRKRDFDSPWTSNQ